MAWKYIIELMYTVLDYHQCLEPTYLCIQCKIVVVQGISDYECYTNHQ